MAFLQIDAFEYSYIIPINQNLGAAKCRPSREVAYDYERGESDIEMKRLIL